MNSSTIAGVSVARVSAIAARKSSVVARKPSPAKCSRSNARCAAFRAAAHSISAGVNGCDGASGVRDRAVEDRCTDRPEAALGQRVAVARDGRDHARALTGERRRERVEQRS
jgi:hypothetical protein